MWLRRFIVGNTTSCHRKSPTKNEKQKERVRKSPRGPAAGWTTKIGKHWLTREVFGHVIFSGCRWHFNQGVLNCIHTKRWLRCPLPNLPKVTFFPCAILHSLTIMTMHQVIFFKNIGPLCWFVSPQCLGKTLNQKNALRQQAPPFWAYNSIRQQDRGLTNDWVKPAFTHQLRLNGSWNPQDLPGCCTSQTVVGPGDFWLPSTVVIDVKKWFPGPYRLHAQFRILCSCVSGLHIRSYLPLG